MSSCTVGSRAQVMNGSCEKTTGGLTKAKLKYNKYGKIVSRAASEKAKQKKNLGPFLVKKGTNKFGLVPKKGTNAYNNIKKGETRSRKSSKGKSKRCPNGSHKSKSGKNCLKIKKSSKRKSKRCPAGSHKSKSGKSCRKK